MINFFRNNKEILIYYKIIIFQYEIIPISPVLTTWSAVFQLIVCPCCSRPQLLVPFPFCVLTAAVDGCPFSAIPPRLPRCSPSQPSLPASFLRHPTAPPKVFSVAAKFGCLVSFAIPPRLPRRPPSQTCMAASFSSYPTAPPTVFSVAAVFGC